MTTKETIEKLNREMSFGDQLEIVKITGISTATVSRFFSCKYLPTPKKQSKMVDAAISIIEGRQKAAKAQEKRVSELSSQVY